MKINKTYEFYLSLIKDSKFLGNLTNLKKIQNWHWVSQQTEYTSLFLAFKGEKVDAVNFIPQSLSLGCRSFVLLPEHEEKAKVLIKEYPEALFILEDPLSFLKRAASMVIEEMPNLLKIGVSGSNGKTTTKEILSSIISVSSINFYATQGNYNSEIGMSLSILQLSGKEEVAVFEMGINQIGEMDELVNLLKPNWVILTSFAEAHVGLLGSLDSIKREKSKITRYAQKVFCPDFIVSEIVLEDTFKGELITYSLENIHLEEVTWEGQFFIWNNKRFFLPLLGKGALLAVSASLKVAYSLGISYESMKEGLLKVSLPKGRMDLIQTSQGISFLNDAYNANLASLKVLLNFIEENKKLVENYQRIFIVFSGFKEMGEESKRIHEQAINEILKLSLWENIFLLEEDLEFFYQDLKNDNKIHFRKNSEGLFSEVKRTFRRGDLVILKGSRSSSLEHLIKLFE